EQYEDGSCEARTELDKRGSVAANDSESVPLLRHRSKNSRWDETPEGMAKLSPDLESRLGIGRNGVYPLSQLPNPLTVKSRAAFRCGNSTPGFPTHRWRTPQGTQAGAGAGYHGLP